MPDTNSTALLDDLLTPEEAAQRLRLSTGTLAKMRYVGRGPSYLKTAGTGGRVRYPLAQLEAWAVGQMHKPVSA